MQNYKDYISEIEKRYKIRFTDIGRKELEDYTQNIDKDTLHLAIGKMFRNINTLPPDMDKIQYILKQYIGEAQAQIDAYKINNAQRQN